jgi:hypothetical protein
MNEQSILKLYLQSSDKLMDAHSHIGSLEALLTYATKTIRLLAEPNQDRVADYIENRMHELRIEKYNKPIYHVKQ